jgi:PhnB protein
MKKKTQKKTAKKLAGKARKAPARSAKKKVAAIPAGYHTITPYLICQGAANAIEFYKKALGAKETVRMPGPGGKVMHAEIQIGNSMVMLADEAPQMGASAPPTLGGSSVGIFLYTQDVDKAYARAIAAGATAEQPPTDMFWGDRYCKFSDPFGHKWSMATHTEDVSPKEMGRRMAEAAAQGANQT